MAAPDAVEIGAFLRAARERQGTYSQEQAAAQVGTTARTIYSWEKGTVTPPAETFFALVALYKADLRKLVRQFPLSPRDAGGGRGRTGGATGT